MSGCRANLSFFLMERKKYVQTLHAIYLAIKHINFIGHLFFLNRKLYIPFFDTMIVSIEFRNEQRTRYKQSLYSFSWWLSCIISGVL